MNKGVLYIAFGEHFVKEMLFSAESVKKHNPDLHVTAFIDRQIESEYVDEVRDRVQNLQNKIENFLAAKEELAV